MKRLPKIMVYSIISFILIFNSMIINTYANNINDYIIISDQNGIETKLYALSEEEHIKFRNNIEKEAEIQPLLNITDEYNLNTYVYTRICTDNNWLNATVKLIFPFHFNSAPKQIKTYMSNQGNTYGPHIISQGNSVTFPKIQWNAGSFSIYAQTVDKSGTVTIQVHD